MFSAGAATLPMFPGQAHDCYRRQPRRTLRAHDPRPARGRHREGQLRSSGNSAWPTPPARTLRQAAPARRSRRPPLPHRDRLVLPEGHAAALLRPLLHVRPCGRWIPTRSARPGRGHGHDSRHGLRRLPDPTAARSAIATRMNRDARSRPATQTATFDQRRRSGAVNEYPAVTAAVSHPEPVPRRIRAFLGGEKAWDTAGRCMSLERAVLPAALRPARRRAPRSADP